MTSSRAMGVFLLLVFVTLVTEGWSESDCECGRWTNPGMRRKRHNLASILGGPRIVGGQEARPHSIPWQVYLVNIRCGGSLVSRKHVVSAAHCGTNIGYVGLGAHDKGQRDDHELIKVLKTTLHPGFNKTIEFNNDISVIELEREVTLGPNIATICLPPANTKIPFDQHMLVSGWGRTGENGALTSKLQFVKVAKVKCIDGERSVYTKDNISDSMFCAMLERRDSCRGDSGGPLTAVSLKDHKVMLLGVVSFGHGCARKDGPGVYTTVWKFLDFIHENTQGTCMAK